MTTSASPGAQYLKDHPQRHVRIERNTSVVIGKDGQGDA
jgi:hypothetical protein